MRFKRVPQPYKDYNTAILHGSPIRVQLTVNTAGALTITGTDGYGTMTIILAAATVGSYELGKGKTSTVTFKQENIIYSTQYDGVEYPVYLSDGKVTIEEVNAETKNIKGTFYFNSYDSTGTKYMNFSEGVFYNLSYVTED